MEPRYILVQDCPKIAALLDRIHGHLFIQFRVRSKVLIYFRLNQSVMMQAFSSFQIQYLRFRGIAEFQVHRVLLEGIAEHVHHLNTCVSQL